MIVLVKDTPVVIRHIRKLRGGSQPILAEASDGFLYVVKFVNNLQGSNLAFNEAMGAELYRAVRLPFSPWRPVRVSDSFLDQNPACWIETPLGLQRPSTGLCFGSRFLGGEGARIFEILPRGAFQQVLNQTDFWLAWLVDVCAEHADNRQAIFREGRDGRLSAVFIDHGHMFGGPWGDQRPPVRASAYLDLRIYQGTTAHFLVQLRKVVANLDTDMLWKEIKRLPEEWKTDSALRSFASCLETLLNEQLVQRVLETIVDVQRPTDRREQFAPPNRRKSPRSVLRHGIQATATMRGTAA